MDLGWLWGPFSLLQEALAEDIGVDRGDLGVHVEQIDEHVYELLKPGQVTGTGTPSVEFVLFHGLKLDSSSSQETHMITTWISRDKKSCWLLWLLEEFPEARILIIGYDASAQRTSSGGHSDLFVTSENIIQCLTADNAHVGRDGCPVLLVGHCFGGLLMKEICCQAQDVVNVSDNARIEMFLANLKGCFFYATPHQGDLLIDANKNALNGRLMKELRLLKNTTARRNQKFCQLRQKRHWSTSSIGEGLPVKLKLFEGIVVPEASARLDTDEFYTSTEADHYNVCQPVDRNSGAYLRLRDFARKFVKEREQTPEGPTLNVKWPSLKRDVTVLLTRLMIFSHMGTSLYLLSVAGRHMNEQMNECEPRPNVRPVYPCRIGDFSLPTGTIVLILLNMFGMGLSPVACNYLVQYCTTNRWLHLKLLGGYNLGWTQRPAPEEANFERPEVNGCTLGPFQHQEASEDDIEQSISQPLESHGQVASLRLLRLWITQRWARLRLSNGSTQPVPPEELQEVLVDSVEHE